MRELGFGRVFGAAVLGLAALFTLQGAAPASGLPWPLASVFWVTHIGLGLGFAVLATRGLSALPALAAWPSLAKLLLSGVAGLALFAPAAVFLEQWLPQGLDIDPADDLLDRWDAEGGPLAVAAEFLQVGPVYLATWLVLNLRPLVTLRIPGGATEAALPYAAPPAPIPQESPEGVVLNGTPAPLEPAAAPSRAWLESLPPLIGQDVISVSSDLHYLHVTTARGRITVLGNLATVERELTALGSRVHRSHWVADRHIRRIARSARGWTCELSDGRRVPISRRRAGEIRAKLGSDFVVTRGD
jgi:hypothetical protein